MTWIPDTFPRADRLNSAGTYHLPLQGSFFPTLHLALPHLGPRRPILTGYIMSDFPLGLAHERLPQKIRRQGEHEVRVLVSLLPPRHHRLAVTLYLRLQLSPTVTLSGSHETFPCPPFFTPRG